LFFLICAQETKHTAHMCGGIKTLKHNVRTTLRSAFTTTVKISHTRAKHVKWNAPKLLQLLGSPFP